MGVIYSLPNLKKQNWRTFAGVRIMEKKWKKYSSRIETTFFSLKFKKKTFRFSIGSNDERICFIIIILLNE